MAIEEKRPANITLGRVVKLFKKSRERIGDIDADKTLLGEDAFGIFYGEIKSNYRRVSYYGDSKGNYSGQGYGAAKRIYEAYFSENGKKYEQRDQLRAHIYEAWNKRLKSGVPGLEEEIGEFLKDNALLESEETSVTRFREFLLRFAKATERKDKAELMTVFTLLGITRWFWEEIDAKDILPANSNRNPSAESEKNDLFEQVRALECKGKYCDAIAELEKAIISIDCAEAERDHVNKQNGKIYHCIGEIYRKLRIETDKGSDDYEKYTNEIKAALSEAIDFKYIPAMIEVARECFEHKEDFIFKEDASKCMELCKSIIATDEDADECGEAFWMLYFLEAEEEKADEYLQKSYSYSYPKAVKVWNERNAVSLVHTLQKSEDTTEGSFYINDINSYSKIICKTAAENWNKCEYPLNKDEVEINLNGLQKFFLISDDFARNLKEILHLLQIFKNNASKLEDKNVEFYIRGYEDEIAPFIDTALERVPVCIPVHILDDDKMAARVLAKHPLFYPIRKLKDSESATLNFVVVGNTPCCEWIIREAFWMLTFRNPNITTKITIIAPNSNIVVEKLEYKCPNIGSDKNDKNNKNNKNKIIPVSILDFNTKDAIDEIEKCINDEKAYFVVDAGSDTFNSSLAVKIRERIIRKYISDGKLGEEFPIIAFRCQDSDIANLMHHSIVLNESAGYKWYNNYALIPFGSVAQSYHWDELTNNLFETIGLNIHLQYYNNDILLKNNDSNYDKEYKSAEKSFWTRSYNRDSSIAVAMSLPYRMYQCLLNEKPILPTRLDPLENKYMSSLDDDAFFSKEAFRAYSLKFKSAGEISAKSSGKESGEWEAAEYQKTIKQRVSGSHSSHKNGIFEDKPGLLCKEIKVDDENSQLYQLAEWEHNRWMRWMVSRGWTKAKISNMKLYHEKGNKRQQLYIAKMHPCITPYQNIDKVDKEWGSLIEKESSFKENDVLAIKKTERVLNMEWTKEREKYLNSREIEERER